MRYAPVVGDGFIQFNTQNGPFANLRLRRAVDLALDRTALAGVHGDPSRARSTFRRRLRRRWQAGGAASSPTSREARALAAGFHGTVTVTTCT